MLTPSEVIEHLKTFHGWWYEGSVVESSILYGSFKPDSVYVWKLLIGKRDDLRRCHDELDDLTVGEKGLLKFLESIYLSERKPKGTS